MSPTERPAESAQIAFQRMLRNLVAPALRAAGFRGSGSRYRLPHPDFNAGLSFQKSRYSTQESITFTVNLFVVHPPTVAAFAAANAVARRHGKYIPVPCAGNWGGRLGEVMPQGRDTWWTLRADDAVEPVADTIIEAITAFGLPAMRRALAEPLRPLEPPQDHPSLAPRAQQWPSMDSPGPRSATRPAAGYPGPLEPPMGPGPPGGDRDV